jgi:hypothetical protein
VVQEVFATTKKHLSEQRARALFREVSAGEPGAPPGARDQAYDLKLLAAYDDAAPLCRTLKERKALPRKIAKCQPKASVQSTTSHIRKLLARREVRQREELARFRRLGRTGSMTSVLGSGGGCAPKEEE